MIGKKGLAVSAVLMMMATVFVGSAGADEVAREDGTTTADAFGPGVPAGWDYVKVVSPSGDSWVAVLWGKGQTVLTKGDIWIVGMWTRYLGAAKVYDQNGALLARSKPLAVKAYFMQRFSAIYEFNDTNGDGIANVVRSNSPIAPGQVIAHEPVYKGASLRAAWEKTGATSEVVDGKKVWNLTLTATDLPYVVIGNSSEVNQSVGDWILNEVSFTFHLWGWRESTNVSVPQFNITVDRSVTPANITTTPAGTKDFTANLTHVKAKEDHSITGWDFDPSNSNSGLVLETNLAYGYFLWSKAPAWMAALWIEKVLKGAGRASFTPEGAAAASTVDGGDASLPDADAGVSANDTVQKVGADRRIEFSGNWEREGLFLWSSDTQVWANETAAPSTGTVNFQLQGARRFAWDLGATGSIKFIGVYLMGGFSYTGGAFYKVQHDPETDLDMGDVQVPDQDNIAPSAKATGPSVLVGYTDAVTLNASASTGAYGGQLGYKWTENGTVLGTSAVLTQQFPVGTHSVKLTVDDGMATNNTTVTFTVINQNPTAKIWTNERGQVMFTTADTVKLDGSGSSDPEGGALKYMWTENGKRLGTNQTLAKKFSSGKHIVTLTVTDPKGGTDSITVTLTIEKKTPGFESLFLIVCLAAAAMLVGRRKK
jgi:hypothetical protein